MRARSLGEADKIYTLFTRERGKLDAVGKGVRRAQSRLGGRLEFGSESALSMHRGRSLDVVTGADLVRSRFAALAAPGAYAAAHLVVELIDAFCEPDHAEPEIYALLGGALDAIGKAPDPAAIVPRFELRLLGALGLAPADAGCVRCDGPIDDGAWADPEAGGSRVRRVPSVPLGRAGSRAARSGAVPRARRGTRRRRRTRRDARDDPRRRELRHAPSRPPSARLPLPRRTRTAGR